MRHANMVFMRGKINSVRAYDGRVFGFLNLSVGACNIPVAVKFGGNNYDGTQLKTLERDIKSSKIRYCSLGGGYVQKTKDNGWEVSVQNNDFKFHTFEIEESATAHFRGRLISITPDKECYWLVVAQSYLYRNPSNGDTEYRDREVRIRATGTYTKDILGTSLLIDGILDCPEGKKENLYIDAYFVTTI